MKTALLLLAALCISAVRASYECYCECGLGPGQVMDVFELEVNDCGDCNEGCKKDNQCAGKSYLSSSCTSSLHDWDGQWMVKPGTTLSGDKVECDSSACCCPVGEYDVTLDIKNKKLHLKGDLAGDCGGSSNVDKEYTVVDAAKTYALLDGFFGNSFILKMGSSSLLWTPQGDNFPKCQVNMEAPGLSGGAIVLIVLAVGACVAGAGVMAFFALRRRRTGYSEM